MALRTRKPTKPIAETLEEEEDKKPAPKANRRKTVAGAAVLSEKVCLNPPYAFLAMDICHILFQLAKERLITIYRLHRGVTRHYRKQATRNLQVNQIGVLALHPMRSLSCQRALHHERQVTAEYVHFKRSQNPRATPMANANFELAGTIEWTDCYVSATWYSPKC